MATVQEPAFTPTDRARLAATTISNRVALPTAGTPTIARVTNLGPEDAFVLMGDSAVAVTLGTGLVVLARTTQYLVIGVNADIAAITQNGNAALNIDVGN